MLQLVTERICEHCNNPFPRPKGITVTKYSKRRFCSVACDHAFHRVAVVVCALEGCDRSLTPRRPSNIYCSRSCGNRSRGNPRYRKIRIDGVNMLEHRHVMETMLGRPLHPWESVHHKNGIRLQNTEDNLELWATAQPAGQRVCDLVAFVAKYYQAELREALAA